MKKRIRASAVCRAGDQVLMVWMRDPRTKITRPFPPGGMIEPNETPAQAAVRECLEETGLRVRVAGEAPVRADYDFTWGEETFAITTWFFLAELEEPFREPPAVEDADYNKGAFWMPLRDVYEALSFDVSIRAGVCRVLGLI